MKDSNFFSDLAARLCNVLPRQLNELKMDLEKNFKVILQSTFNKLDLVTREEFDAQTKVLARSRQKIEALELKISELEKVLSQKSD